MKVPQELPHFMSETALFIVSGKQEARFFEQSGTILEELEEFKVEKPRYSDREGFFITRTRGGTIRSGAPYEAKDQKTLQDFKRLMKEQLHKLAKRQGYHHVYLLAPDYVLPEIRDCLPPALAKHLRQSVTGEYTHQHPLYWLRRINDPTPKRAETNWSREATEIMDTPRLRPKHSRD